MRRKKEPEAGPAPAPRAATLPPGPAPRPAARSGRDHLAQAGAAAPPAGAAASTAATPGAQATPLLRPGARLGREPRESGEQWAGPSQSPRPPSPSWGFQTPEARRGVRGVRGVTGVGLQLPACRAGRRLRRGAMVSRSDGFRLRKPILVFCVSRLGFAKEGNTNGDLRICMDAGTEPNTFRT